MVIRRYRIVAVSITLAMSPMCVANESDQYLTLAVGHVAAFDHNIDDPVVYKAEFRFRPATKWLLAPSIGAARSGNSASFVFADLEKDFFPRKHWVVTPSFGLGVFDDGRDVRLGHDLEFRSGIKIAFVFDNKVRLGIALFHLSNGGLGDRNPGTEPVFLSLAVPL